MDDLFQCDPRSEYYKAGWHVVGFGVNGVLAAYSIGSLFVRPSRLLKFQSVLYSGLTIWEWTRVMSHLRAR